MMSLDLIVTCDTSIAHLAGALGRPVLVALPAVADWRWLQRPRRHAVVSDDAAVPAGEGARQPQDWSGVFARIAAAAGEMAKR